MSFVVLRRSTKRDDPADEGGAKQDGVVALAGRSAMASCTGRLSYGVGASSYILAQINGGLGVGVCWRLPCRGKEGVHIVSLEEVTHAQKHQATERASLPQNVQDK